LFVFASSVVLAKHATELYLYDPKVQPFQQPDAWLQHVVKDDGKAPVSLKSKNV
jgi:hypothetical protein